MPVAPNHNHRYGWHHRRLRAAWIHTAWGTPCARCGQPMLRGQALHLDHDDSDPTGSTYRGFSHAACNTRAGADKTNATDRPPPPLRTSQEW